MEVSLIHSTPLVVCSKAIRTCWDSHNKSDSTNDTCGTDDLALIDRVANKMKHESVKNHINLVFEINGITTKTLLALTRHDIGTEFSVQSTRYTTKKCVLNGSASYTESKDARINAYLQKINIMIEEAVDLGISNDEISMMLPQAWNYNLVATFSLTALQHFIRLRLKKDAHWDIQELAHKLLECIPEELLYLFEDYVKGE